MFANETTFAIMATYLWPLTVRRGYDVKKWRLESPFSHSDNQTYFTCVFIRSCTVVTSWDMTSFVYIGDEKHHLSKWLGKEKK